MRALSADERRSSPTYRAVCSTSSGPEPDAYAAFVAETELSVELTENRWRSQVGRVVYWSARGELEAEGMSSLDASRIGVRIARAAILRLGRVEQRAIPGLLAASKRTCDSDLKRWRRVIDSGAAERVGARPLPPIPKPDERVAVAGWSA
jgi:hypothetical protein